MLRVATNVGTLLTCSATPGLATYASLDASAARAALYLLPHPVSLTLLLVLPQTQHDASTRGAGH